MNAQNSDADQSRGDHADRLQRDGGDRHPAACGFWRDLGDVGAAGRKVYSNADAQHELPGKDEPRIRRDHAER
jgi:hypothetical protein